MVLTVCQCRPTRSATWRIGSNVTRRSTHWRKVVVTGERPGNQSMRSRVGPQAGQARYAVYVVDGLSSPSVA